MATTMSVTPSMDAHADCLLERAPQWAHGTRVSDGLAFYLFASSRTLADGTPIMNMTRTDGRGCTCKSFYYRNLCSHVVAVRRYAEQEAAIEAEFAGIRATKDAASSARRKATYEELFGKDEF